MEDLHRASHRHRHHHHHHHRVPATAIDGCYHPHYHQRFVGRAIASVYRFRRFDDAYPFGCCCAESHPFRCLRLNSILACDHHRFDRRRRHRHRRRCDSDSDSGFDFDFVPAIPPPALQQPINQAIERSSDRAIERSRDQHSQSQSVKIKGPNKSADLHIRFRSRSFVEVIEIVPPVELRITRGPPPASFGGERVRLLPRSLPPPPPLPLPPPPPLLPPPLSLPPSFRRCTCNRGLSLIVPGRIYYHTTQKDPVKPSNKLAEQKTSG